MAILAVKIVRGGKNISNCSPRFALGHESLDCGREGLPSSTLSIPTVLRHTQVLPALWSRGHKDGSKRRS